MGAVADRCSNLSPAEKHANIRNNSHRGMAKALDEDSSEGEDEEEEEDDEKDSELEGSEAEEMRAETELALQEGPKGTSFATFHEVIDHAKGLGIGADKIKKAEQLLEQHRAQQRRELFQADVKEFLVSAKADSLDECKERLNEGTGHGCSETVLKPLRERIANLELCIDLAADEVAKAKLFLELCTRRFVKSCVVGRETVWVDLKANKRVKAVLHLDVVLKNFTVKSAKGEQLAAAKVADFEVKRALDAGSVSNTEAFGKLPEKEKMFGVALVGESDTWLIGENNCASQDEFLVGLAVLNRRGIEAAEPETGKSKAAPKMVTRSGSMLADEEVVSPTEDGEAPVSAKEEAIEKKQPEGNEEEDIGFQEVEEDTTVAPVPEAEPEEKQDKKDKKEKKEKKEKKHKKESK